MSRIKRFITTMKHNHIHTAATVTFMSFAHFAVLIALSVREKLG